MTIELRPTRLQPGADLRTALESAITGDHQANAFVISGIGSLVDAKLRFAGNDDESSVTGPLELLTLAGSLSSDGAHLHASVANATGQVFGGHVCYGCEVRTTAEILLALLPDGMLSRELDPATGYRELVVRRS